MDEELIMMCNAAENEKWTVETISQWLTARVS